MDQGINRPPLPDPEETRKKRRTFLQALGWTGAAAGIAWLTRSAFVNLRDHRNFHQDHRQYVVDKYFQAKGGILGNNIEMRRRGAPSQLVPRWKRTGSYLNERFATEDVLKELDKTLIPALLLEWANVVKNMRMHAPDGPKFPSVMHEVHNNVLRAYGYAGGDIDALIERKIIDSEAVELMHSALRNWQDPGKTEIIFHPLTEEDGLKLQRARPRVPLSR